jgi:membrane protein YqaA with SNARE-associated domain
VATAGSVTGAYLTFRASRRAGMNYLQRKFGERRVAVFLRHFRQWGTAGLVISTLVPLPFPTSAFFAAAGVLDYPLRTFLAVVVLCRAARYAAISAIAYRYGRHFVRALRHPRQSTGWFALIIVTVLLLVAAAFWLRRRWEQAGERAQSS